MKNSFYWIAIFSLLALNTISGQQKVSPEQIDWPQFLSRHDMYWDRITADYYSGAIMGNGLLGNNIYKEDNAYKFHIGRVDVTEGRSREGRTDYNHVFDAARLPIGHFLLKPVGSMTSERMRLTLWDAITNGTISTNRGTIAFKSYVHASQDVIVLETSAEGDEVNFSWEWVPLEALSPRAIFYPNLQPAHYRDHPNPAVKVSTDGEYRLSIQNLFGGKTYVVAWRESKQDNTRRIYITISLEDTEALAISKAKEEIDRAWQESYIALEDSHKKWWHDYYPGCFATFGNAKMESFYWIQHYKAACLTRPDKYNIDLQGPWAVRNTPWPAVWLNLNTQLTYSWMFTGNRSSLSKPLWKGLNDNIDNLAANVPVAAWRADAAVVGQSSTYDFYAPLDPIVTSKSSYNGKHEVGNLPWILYHYYEYCIYQGDDDELVNRFFPLLKRSMAYYEYIRETRTDGSYHLPITDSPEYNAWGKDCNYDLSLLHWGLNTLLEINSKYSLNDPKAADWTDFKDKLTDYSTDPTRGYMIAENVNLTTSHRHYSHLLMIYPLYTVNWDQGQEARDMITKSIAHWQSLTGSLQGYSFTGSSSMYSSMGDGERALTQLQRLIDSYIKPNTLYAESGPVIETPFAAVTSLQELYLQSWGDKIRVFPAVPANWQRASFIDFRTRGAFLISATRDGGKTVWIQVESEKGGLCRLQTGMPAANIQVKDINGQDVHFTVMDPATGLIEVSTVAGDVFQVSDRSLTPVMPAPIAHPSSTANPYGVNSGPEDTGESIVWYVGSPDQWAGKPGEQVVSTLSEAYSNAAYGDKVWVAAGEYSIPSITLKNGVSVYGSFAGTENSPAEREKVAGGKAWEFVNPSILQNSSPTQGQLFGSPSAPSALTLDGFVMEGAAGTTNCKAVSITTGAGSNNNYIISNCIIRNFRATTDGGGFNVRYTTEILNCLITNNESTTKGGGGYFDNVTIHDCEVINNRAPLSGTVPAGSGNGCGGGLFMANNTVTGYNLYVADNTANFAGGIFLRTAGRLYNSVIVNNTANRSGGGLAFDERDSNSIGYNLTIANNRANDANGSGGVCFSADGSDRIQSLYNTILWNNTNGAGAVANIGINNSGAGRARPVARNNLIDRITDYHADIALSASVVATDSASIFDANWLTKAGSPAEDKGTSTIATSTSNITLPATDMTGNLRVQGAAIDIGPYETTGNVSVTGISPDTSLRIYYTATGVHIVSNRSIPAKWVNIVGKTMKSFMLSEGDQELSLAAYPKGIYLLVIGDKIFKVLNK